MKRVSQTFPSCLSCPATWPVAIVTLSGCTAILHIQTDVYTDRQMWICGRHTDRQIHRQANRHTENLHKDHLQKSWGNCWKSFTEAARTHYMFTLPLPSKRQHLSNDDCLEGKTEGYQVCSVQYCVQQVCTVQCTHIRTDLTVVCWLDLAFLWLYCALQLMCFI